MRLTEEQYRALKNDAALNVRLEAHTIIPFPDDAYLIRNTPHSKALQSLFRKPESYQRQCEHWHQCYIFHYYEMYFPDVYALLYATPNAGARGKVERGRLLSAGLKAGFPDLSLDMARKGYHGLRCELKRPEKNAAVSTYQTAWLARLENAGYKAFIAYGFVEAIEEINRYCELKGGLQSTAKSYSRP